MKIYGVAILGACFIVGQLIGEQLGVIIDVSGNVGGVGFGMLLLILANKYLSKKAPLSKDSEKGILFWSSMYIPVVIAMSATQNVKAALSGGWVAIMVGLIATGISFSMIPLIARIGRKK